MALIVLLGFGGLYMLVGDQYLKEGPSIEAVIEENGKEINHLRKNIASATGKLGEFDEIKKASFEFQRSEVTARELESRRDNLAAEQDAAREKLAAVVAEFDGYKEEYRDSARKSLEGTVIADLELPDGQVLHDVKVSKVDPIRMSYQHTNGFGKINLADLPQDIRDYLQYSAEEEDDRRLAEIQKGNQTELQVKVAQQEDLVIRLQNELTQLRAAVQSKRDMLKRSKTAIPQQQQRVEAMRIEIDKERRKSVSHVPEMRGKLRRLESDLRDMNKAVPQIGRDISTLTQEISQKEEQLLEARQKLAEIHSGKVE
ncbi:hypothetical protein [Haloferula sargassicola]